MRTLLFALLVSVTSASQTFNWPTLAEELATHNVPSAQLDDRDRRITSYAVFDEGDWFAIAYYWNVDPGTPLPTTARFRAYNRRAPEWRSATFEGDWGSLLEIHRAQRWWYVKGHWTPSATPTIVLSDDLRLIRELKGWPMLVLPDGRLVYHNNMIHFAPAHPGSLSLYDPVANKDVRLFPSKEDLVGPDLIMIDRDIDDVRRVGQSNTIQFIAIEQRIRLDSGRGNPDGPARRLSVTCDLSVLACRTTEIKPERQQP